jgi:hypothetical protein
MSVVAIDRSKADRVVFTCPHELRQAITEYRRAQPDLPSESKAIADLIQQALARWREEQQAETRRKP